MHHAVLGPGGVGGLLAAALAASGHEVTLVVRPGTRERYSGDLTVDGPFGIIQASVTVAERLERPVDALWIAVKATQLVASLEQIPDPGLAGLILPLLNGVDHVALLRGHLGSERVMPATISVESERLAPGRITVRSPFIRLRIAERARPVVSPAVAALARFGFDCAFVADEATLLWSKLVFLAPLALSTTAAEAPVGEVLSGATANGRLARCLHEACAVAAASGALVDEQAVMAGIRSLPADLRSSMQKDRAAGRPLELDAIAGPIIRGGRHHRIPTPATELLARDAGAGALPPAPRTRRA